MAKQDASGCAILLALIGLGLVLAYWQFFLTILAVVGSVALVANLVQSQRLARLKSVVEGANRRFAGDVCRWGDQYGLLEAIGITSPPAPARIEVKLATLGDEDGALALNQASVPLVPPADLGTITSNLAFKGFLESQGITLVNDLAVEAKATRAALNCQKESQWARQSLDTLQEMVRSASRTLAMAKGNELLEPSIPQLQQALSTFEEEQARLSGYLKESLSMLRKLNDFLSVPETIRPILNFDLDHVFDPGRFQQLADSFQEVVTLTAVFQDLSRDRVA